jgi:hypothetical protein
LGKDGLGPNAAVAGAHGSHRQSMERAEANDDGVGDTMHGWW